MSVARSHRLLWFLLFPVCFCVADPGRAENAATAPRRATTFGLLQGGSLIGFDNEYSITDRVGLQVGAGLVGFDGGITYHYREPDIRSRHFYLGYWNLGLQFTDTYVSMLGLSHVWRSPSLFTAQLGLGAILSMGASAERRFGRPAVALVYSIGICPMPRSGSSAHGRSGESEDTARRVGGAAERVLYSAAP